MTPPLDGIRVLDLTNVMAGPFCTYQLALMGADVVKIEPPGRGDLARQLGADPALNAERMGTSFLAQNAGKRSVTIDLKTERGRALFDGLVETADVVVQSFRPGVMERLGCGAERLRGLKPRLVYCALSGFGQSGPMSERPAYDQIIQGLSGIMSVTGDEDTAPLRTGFPVSDAIAGLNAALAISAALVGVARRGEGATIDVAMLDATIATAAWVVSNYLIAGQPPAPMGNENRTASPSGTFRTRDGLLNIAANKQDQWERLAAALGLEELAHDPRFADREARKRHRTELTRLVETALAEYDAEHWEGILNARGVPAGRVLSVPDAVALPQLAQRRLFRTFDDAPGVGRPLTVTDTGFVFEEVGRVSIGPPPRLGEHTGQILEQIGVGPDELEALRVEGIV